MTGPALSGFNADEAQLVVGYVRGYRGWVVPTGDDFDREQPLEAVVYRYKWTPGENVCSCLFKDALEKIDLLNLNDYLLESMGVTLHEKHSMPDCECGFYAYFHPKNQSYTNNVTGVIDAYGETVIGELGFRASKAKIRALHVPGYTGKRAPEQSLRERLRHTAWNLRNKLQNSSAWNVDPAIMAISLYFLIPTLFGLSQGVFARPALFENLVICLVSGWISFMIGSAIAAFYRQKTPYSRTQLGKMEEFDSVNELGDFLGDTYGVPVYGDEYQMLRHFPPSSSKDFA